MDHSTSYRIALDAARERERALRRQLREEQERVKAAGIALDAVVASLRWHGLDRRKFKSLILEAARATPDAGPEAARHKMFHAHATKLLQGSGPHPTDSPSQNGS